MLRFEKIRALVLVASAALGVAAFSQPAAAGFSLSAVGVLNLSNQSVSPPNATQNTAVGTTVGFGFLASMPVFPMFSAELGALYVPRKGSLNDINGTNILTATETTFEFPLVLRFTLLPIINFGAGVYYAKATGSINVSAPGISDASYTFDNQNRASSDFGVLASVGASIPILPLISVIGDLRYLIGLTNQDSTGVQTTHYRDFEFLAGVSLGL